MTFFSPIPRLRGTLFPVVLLALFHFLHATGALHAKPAQFEFLYQTIEKKIELNPVIPPPQPGFWNKLKYGIKKVGSGIKSAYYGLARVGDRLRNQYFPKKNGRTRWYSRSDKNVAWEVRRVKVSTEAELLAAMGVTDPAKMTNEQKGLLESFRFTQSKFISDRNELSNAGTIRFFLTEGGNFNNDAVYGDDFWPHNAGTMVVIGSNYFNWRDPKEAAQTLIAHEFSHSYDRTVREGDAYGPDDSHYVNEITAPRGAWVEGWAEFNEMAISEDEREYIRSSIKKVKKEGSKAGDYRVYPAEEATAKDLLNCEGYNAAILYNLYSGLPDGEKKVLAAFKKSNSMGRGLKEFLSTLVQLYPEDGQKIVAITQQTLLGKLSESEARELFGPSNPSVQNYFQAISHTAQSAPNFNPINDRPKAAPVTGALHSTASGSIIVDDETKKRAFEKFTASKLAYKKAVEDKMDPKKVEELHSAYIDSMAQYKELMNGREETHRH